MFWLDDLTDIHRGRLWHNQQVAQAELGRDFRRLRQQKGWTPAALAKHAKVDNETVTRLERGGNVTLETISAIAKPLGARLVARLVPEEFGDLRSVEVLEALGEHVNTGTSKEIDVPWLLKRIHPRLLMALANLRWTEQVELYNTVIAPRHNLEPIEGEEPTTPEADPQPPPKS